MAVVGRRRARGITYYVNFSWRGRQVWERAGSDKREAERLDRRRKQQVRDGSYSCEPKSTMPFEQFAEKWMSRRTNRAAPEENGYLRRYVLSREWFASLPLEELRPRHIIELVGELKTIVSDTTGKPLSAKTVSNIYGLVRTLVRDARIAELVPIDACVLPRGFLRRRARTGTRQPYTMTEVHALTSDRVESSGRMFAALALYTGMREGEICGRRWRDLDRAASPLGCLSVDSQYEGRPLKTDGDASGEHARKVPIHPDLLAILDWWAREGFELVHLRGPTDDDFIVPRKGGKPHTRSSAYKLWRRCCIQSGAANRSLHSTRHTFITQCRRGGGRSDVVERITHNAAGTILDQYTHWDWAPLCEAVRCFGLDAGPDASAKNSMISSGGAGNRTADSGRQLVSNRVDTQTPAATVGSRSDEKFHDEPASHAARQDRKARAPRNVQGYVRARLLEALPCALRGDRDGTLTPLAKAARVLVGTPRTAGRFGASIDDRAT